MKYIFYPWFYTGISCSICGDILQGARELGVHILAAHCDPSQRDELEKDRGDEEEEEEDELDEDNLVIDGSPGESMEVDVDPLEEDILGPADDVIGDDVSQEIPLTINLPRKQTAAEARQRFMAYRLPDGGQRYICLVCEKMYTSRYNIRMHMNLHTGNNVHTCTFCGRRFAHKHVYESHVRTHTGERPYACDKCDRKFGDRSNCASHMKRCCLAAGGASNNNNNNSPESSSPMNSVLKVEKEDAEEEEEKEEEKKESSMMMPGSISIAPNVSLTPISKLKKPEEGVPVRPRLFELATAASISFTSGSTNTATFAVVGSGQPSQQTQQQLVLVKFQPQIVAVQSIGAMPVLAATTATTAAANSDDFVNMGYVPGEDDMEEEEEGIADDSEEVMIEPDISLDYDDIEETTGTPQEEQATTTINNNSTMVDKQVLFAVININSVTLKQS
jgi:Zinc finger, C2H2 type